jgi:hypothetical protein
MIFLSMIDRHRKKVFLREIRFYLRKNARLGCIEREASRKKSLENHWFWDWRKPELIFRRRRGLLQIVLQRVWGQTAFFSDAEAVCHARIAQMVQTWYHFIAEVNWCEGIDINACPTFKTSGNINAPFQKNVPRHFIHCINRSIIPLFVA